MSDAPSELFKVHVGGFQVRIEHVHFTLTKSVVDSNKLPVVISAEYDDSLGATILTRYAEDPYLEWKYLSLDDVEGWVLARPHERLGAYNWVDAGEDYFFTDDDWNDLDELFSEAAEQRVRIAFDDAHFAFKQALESGIAIS